MHTKTDEILVHEFLEGREEAFEELVTRYMDGLYSLAYRFTQNEHDAEDIAQLTFVRVYEYLPKSKTDLPFKPWLFQICVNLCRNLKKKKTHLTFTQLKKEDEQDVGMEEHIQDTQELPDEALKREERKDTVQDAIKNLPEKFQIVLQLRYMDDMTYEEISDILKIPINTVRTHLNRAKQKLTQALSYLYTP